MVVTHPSGDTSHALFIYPSGPKGHPAKFLGSDARHLDGEESQAAEQARVGAKRRRDHENADRITSGRAATTLRLDQRESPEVVSLLNQRRLCYGQPRHCEIIA